MAFLPFVLQGLADGEKEVSMNAIYEHRQPGVLMRWILWAARPLPDSGAFISECGADTPGGFLPVRSS